MHRLPISAVPGNGNYAVGGIGNLPRADAQGASLIVVYSRAGGKTGRVYLKFGALTGLPGEPRMAHTFKGLQVPGPVVTGSAKLHIGMADGEAFTDQPMRFGGPAGGPPITPANFWTGADGKYWDDSRISIPKSLLPQGTTSRTNTQDGSAGSGGDCLAWAYAGLTDRHFAG